MAYTALANSGAAAKRIVIISDGDPGAPSTGLLKQFVESQISVSTVCIAPHSPNDQNMLRWIAQTTGGQYYFVTNPNNLPQIFTKEAATIKRGLLVEKEIQPLPLHDSELLTGFRAAELPILRGYVLTSAKSDATVALLSPDEDPILAHWRYGLGKSVAFTSDVTSRWAADWLGWQSFSPFWSQAIRWAVRERKPSDFRVQTSVKDGKGYVRIDAVDAQGKFVNFLKPKGVVVGPEPGFRRQELAIRQTAPGIYEDSFPLDEKGLYMINMTYTNPDGTQGNIQTGLALAYSQEYQYNSSNLMLLDQIASLGGGKTYDHASNPFEHTLQATATITPIWGYLVAFAVCLFPIEIFLRRVMISFAPIFICLAKLLRLLPAMKRFIPLPSLAPARITGTYRAASAPEFDFTSEAEEETERTFGIRVAPVSTETKTTEGTERGEAKQKAAEGHSEYTQQLLQAKKRALDKRKRGGQDGS